MVCMGSEPVKVDKKIPKSLIFAADSETGFLRTTEIVGSLVRLVMIQIIRTPD